MAGASTATATQSRAVSEALAEAQSAPVEETAGAVSVGGEQFVLSKLSIDQWTGIGRLALKAYGRMQQADRELLQKAAGGPDGNVAAVMAILDPETIRGFYGLLLNKPEKWIDQHFDMAEFLEVVSASGEVNDLRQVWSAFQKVVSRWSPPSRTS